MNNNVIKELDILHVKQQQIGGYPYFLGTVEFFTDFGRKQYRAVTQVIWDVDGNTVSIERHDGLPRCAHPKRSEINQDALTLLRHAEYWKRSARGRQNDHF